MRKKPRTFQSLSQKDRKFKIGICSTLTCLALLILGVLAYLTYTGVIHGKKSHVLFPSDYALSTSGILEQFKTENNPFNKPNLRGIDGDTTNADADIGEPVVDIKSSTASEEASQDKFERVARANDVRRAELLQVSMCVYLCVCMCVCVGVYV